MNQLPKNPSSANPDLRLIRISEVARLTSVSRSKIYRAMRAGLFPRSIRFGRVTWWIESEVHDWITERIAASREGGNAR